MKSQIILPIKGPVDQAGVAQKYWADGWAGNNFEVELDPFEMISEILISGRLRKNSPKGITLAAAIDDQPQGEFKVEGESFEWHLKLNPALVKPFKLKITGDKWLNCKRDGVSEDKRDLLFVLDKIKVLTNTRKGFSGMKSQIILPIKGPVDQVGTAKEYWADGWAGNNFEVELDPFEKISEVLICGRLRKNSPQGITLTAAIDDHPQGEFKVDWKSFKWHLKFASVITKPFKLKITGDKWLNCQRDGASEDNRDLLFILNELRFITHFILRREMLISLHMPKTAGTSFQETLVKNFYESILFDYHYSEGILKELINKKNLDEKEKEKLKLYCTENDVRCIHGHFEITKYIDVFDPAVYVTFLRDPVERQISNYNYQKHFPWDTQLASGAIRIEVNPRGHDIWTGKLDLEGFLLHPDVANHYKLYGLDQYFDQFDFIGIMECYDKSLKILSKLLGLDYIKPKKINVSKKQFSVSDLSPQLLQKLRRINAIDYSIYYKALSKLDTY